MSKILSKISKKKELLERKKKKEENKAKQAQPYLQFNSPSDTLTAMNKISIDLCGCCNQPCDGNGIYGQALQSNLCESYHAMCENFGRKQYKSFSSLKRIIAEFVRSSMDKSDEVLDLFKDSFKKLNKICSFYHDSSNWIVH